MSAEDDRRFKSNNKCCICNKLFVARDNKVRDQDHVTGKYRGDAHWSCNNNLKLTKKVPVIFYNLKGHASHLIMQEINKFEVTIFVLVSGLEKYMAFKINRNLVSTHSMQFMNSSVDTLNKNLSENDFKHLLQEFSGNLLE